MIDRDRIRSLAMAIRDHAAMLESFATAPDSTPYMLEKEALGRANLIEGRLAQLRTEVMIPDSAFTFTNIVGTKTWEPTGLTPPRGLHVIGDRPTDDEAA